MHLIITCMTGPERTPTLDERRMHGNSAKAPLDPGGPARAAFGAAGVAKEYKTTDYLPLAVGNSWTYKHDYQDLDNPHLDQPDTSPWTAYTAQYPKTPQFTIEVLREEVIDGQTYFVIGHAGGLAAGPVLFNRRQEAALVGYRSDGAHRRRRADLLPLWRN